MTSKKVNPNLTLKEKAKNQIFRVLSINQILDFNFSFFSFSPFSLFKLSHTQHRFRSQTFLTERLCSSFSVALFLHRLWMACDRVCGKHRRHHTKVLCRQVQVQKAACGCVRQVLNTHTNTNTKIAAHSSSSHTQQYWYKSESFHLFHQHKWHANEKVDGRTVELQSHFTVPITALLNLQIIAYSLCRHSPFVRKQIDELATNATNQQNKWISRKICFKAIKKNYYFLHILILAQKTIYDCSTFSWYSHKDVDIQKHNYHSLVLTTHSEKGT